MSEHDFAREVAGHDHNPVAGFSGAVLAGGASRRFGSDKREHVYRGRTLMQHSLSALQAADEMFVVGAKPPAGSGATEIHDIHRGFGPVGGIHSALTHASRSWVAVVACDMPFVHPRLWHFLMSRSREKLLVIPESSRGLEPLAALYHRDLVPWLSTRIDLGNLSVHSLHEAVPHAVVSWPELRSSFGPNIFLNANRREDLP